MAAARATAQGVQGHARDRKPARDRGTAEPAEMDPAA